MRWIALIPLFILMLIRNQGPYDHDGPLSMWLPWGEARRKVLRAQAILKELEQQSRFRYRPRQRPF
jgi:hypothetical protein